MSDFNTFLSIGFDHILDVKAYDHIVFLIALCAVYRVAQWQQVLILVTAFTIGHSVTLALATYGTILIPSDFIEFLIPLTILLTAIANIFVTNDTTSKASKRLNYGMALLFGLIHGMGFSNYLRILLGQEESIVVSLLAFNLGLEAGQILIVGFIFFMTFLALNIFRLPQRYWNIAVSAFAGVVAIILMMQTKPW